MSERTETPIATAIRLTGGLTALAEACGVKYQAVQKWRDEWTQKQCVPADPCPAIERATKGVVRCEDLRPDVTWQRDANGQVTGYVVLVGAAAHPSEVSIGA